MSKTLTKTAEARLYGAIEKTASYVDDGLHPNNAIAKAAAEQGVPPGHINLMVHAFNTGRTTRTRQDGDNPFEKAADFPLADATVVLAQMYPEKGHLKTSAAIRQSTIVSTEYVGPPTGVLERRASREKAANSIDWRAPVITGDRPAAGYENRFTANEARIEAPEAYPTDPNYRAKKAAADVQRLQRSVDDKRRQAAAAFDKMGETFCEMTEYFRRPGCVPLRVVKENAVLMHGDRGEQIIDQLIRVTPGLAKMAHNQRSISSARELSAHGEPYTLIATLVDQIGQYKQAKQDYLSLQGAAEKQAEVLLHPFVVGSPSRSVLDEPSSTEKSAMGVLGGLMQAAMLKNTLDSSAKRMGRGSTGDLQQQALSAITDPAHEEELRTLRTSAMLQHLAQHDEVISGFNPDDIVDAFNEISDLVPQASDQMMVMRQMLRDKLKGGELGMHEMAQAIDVGSKLRDRDMPHQSDIAMRKMEQDDLQNKDRTRQTEQQMKLERSKFDADRSHKQEQLSLDRARAQAENQRFEQQHSRQINMDDFDREFRTRQLGQNDAKSQFEAAQAEIRNNLAQDTRGDQLGQHADKLMLDRAKMLQQSQLASQDIGARQSLTQQQMDAQRMIADANRASQEGIANRQLGQQGDIALGALGGQDTEQRRHNLVTETANPIDLP